MTTVTSEPRLLYRDMRSRAEVIADDYIKENVLRGIEWLNETYGPDWVDHVDPNELILSNGNSCVIGQVYANEAEEHGHTSGWDYLADQMRPAGGGFTGDEAFGTWAFERGFCTMPYDPNDRIASIEFSDLDEAWKTVLA